MADLLSNDLGMKAPIAIFDFQIFNCGLKDQGHPYYSSTLKTFEDTFSGTPLFFGQHSQIPSTRHKANPATGTSREPEAVEDHPTMLCWAL